MRGPLQDGRLFDFTLSREGASAGELSAAMDRSWTEFKESLGTSTPLDAPYTTSFDYGLTAVDTAEIIDTGIRSLETCAPYVLAFNQKLRRVDLIRDGIRSRYARDPAQDSDIARVVAVIDDKITRLAVALAAHDSSTVAVLLSEHEERVQVADASLAPKLFLAYPLIGTEDFAFPAVVNSRKFTPTEARDGVFLGLGDNSVNADNQAAMECAREALLELIRTGVTDGWGSLSRLFNFRDIVEKGWLNPQWLATEQRCLLEAILQEQIVKTEVGANVAPSDAWIPAGSAADVVSALTRRLVGTDARLPCGDAIESWALCIHSWARVLDIDVEEVSGAWTLRKLTDWASDFKTLDALQEQLKPGDDAIAWLNALLAAIGNCGKTSLLDDFPILPDQNGVFDLRSRLKRDPGIDDELKNICRDLGAPVSGGLLHTGARLGVMEHLLEQDSEDRVVDHALARLKEQSGKTDPESAKPVARANVDLFAWLVGHERFVSLDAYPALTVDETQSTTLSRDADVDDHPLAPASLWPEHLRPFSSLFPKRHVLSDLYFGRCSDEATWTRLRQQAGILLSPVYTVDAYIRQFLPDEPLDGKDDGPPHESRTEYGRTRIAYLTKSDVGIMNTVRKSVPKATALLRMAVSIIAHDARELELLAADCDCGETHRYFQSDWITALHDDRWIPLGTGRGAAAPNADSMAFLVQQWNDCGELLRDPAFEALTRAFGISLAEVTLRALTASEQERASLVQAFTGLVDAAGGSAVVISVLADEIQNHPELIEELEQKRKTRARVAANKILGERVEKALKARLEALGLKVTRTGVGSDYEIDSDILENGEETWFRLESGDKAFLLEVKATTTEAVRMTRRQGQTAVEEQRRFALGVVASADCFWQQVEARQLRPRSSHTKQNVQRQRRLRPPRMSADTR